MDTTLTDTLASFNESSLKTVAGLQEQILAFQRDVSNAVAKAADLPSWVPTPQPLAEVDLESLVGQAYDFQAQRLEEDKQFALGLVGIWSAATPAPKAARGTKSAAK
jgi:hypothetical protein